MRLYLNENCYFNIYSGWEDYSINYIEGSTYWLVLRLELNETTMDELKAAIQLYFTGDIWITLDENKTIYFTDLMFKFIEQHLDCYTISFQKEFD